MPRPSKMSMNVCAWWRAYDAWQSPTWSGTCESGRPISRSTASGGQERLGIHRVHVVDAVEERRRHAAVAQCPGDDVEDDRATETPDVNRPGGSLRVVDELRPVNGGGQLVGPVHRVRPWPFDRRGGGRTGRASRRRGAGAQLILLIAYVKSLPFGSRTVIFSPALRPRSARPTGDSLEIFPSAGRASAEPTIENVSRPSRLSTTTVEPSAAWSERGFSMITAVLSMPSRVWIRPSTKACSFLASSYSAFSERSPCCFASWIRAATSARRTFTRVSSSWRRPVSPSRER